MRKALVTIVSGTRPEIIKLAPVYRALADDAAIQVRWIHTGQHDAMGAEMLRCFGITPDVQLARTGTTLEQFSTGCRTQLDVLRARERWDLCIVQGDTESAFVGALCAFYGRVPVAHVEAGLRTHDLRRPFPEEGIRQMITRISRLHFAPTAGAETALLEEGVPPARIRVTGNTVVDAQHWICKLHDVRRDVPPGQEHILVTAHRREHWGEELEQIFQAVADIARTHPQRRVLFPVHLNPRVREPANALLGALANVALLQPLDYVAMQRALANAVLLLTDSGGLQEEAPTFGVPTVVLRRETERPEAVAAGCAELVGPQRLAIVAAASRLLAHCPAADPMRRAVNPFGDGHASERIAAAVRALLASRESRRLPRRPPARQAMRRGWPSPALLCPPEEKLS